MVAGISEHGSSCLKHEEKLNPVLCGSERHRITGWLRFAARSQAEKKDSGRIKTVLGKQTRSA
jgi:hypothetical protein